MTPDQIESLIEDSLCINTCIPQGMQLAVLINLASRILTNGGAAPDSINYAGPPAVNPPALQNIVVDVNGRQWMYYGGAWN